MFKATTTKPVVMTAPEKISQPQITQSEPSQIGSIKSRRKIIQSMYQRHETERKSQQAVEKESAVKVKKITQ